jgi:putative methionine-R-sulfoxide reductase with GAF domain
MVNSRTPGNRCVTRDSRWLATFGTSKAEAIFQVTLHGAVVGTIDVESDRVGTFTREDEDILRGAAVVVRPLWAAPDRMV